MGSRALAPGLLAGLLAGAAHAAAAQQAPGYAETGATYHGVSAGLGDWRGAHARAFQPVGARSVVGGELVLREAFRDRGVFAGASLTHELDADWFVAASAGAGSGEFFFPRLRADAQLSRRWLPGRPLVTTVGAGYVAAQDAHRDAAVRLAASYYFRAPVVAEAGVSWNRSTPGAVVSRRQYGALTVGRHGTRYLAARVAGGREAYQPLGGGRALVDFRSHEASLAWREWVGRSWGIHLAAELYGNPTYHRAGVTLGVFRDLRPRGGVAAPPAPPAPLGLGGPGAAAGRGRGADRAAPRAAPGGGAPGGAAAGGAPGGGGAAGLGAGGAAGV